MAHHMDKSCLTWVGTLVKWRRLIFKRLWVRIPALETGWLFIHTYLLQKLYFLFEMTKNKPKDAEDIRLLQVACLKMGYLRQQQRRRQQQQRQWRRRRCSLTVSSDVRLFRISFVLCFSCFLFFLLSQQQFHLKIVVAEQFNFILASSNKAALVLTGVSKPPILRFKAAFSHRLVTFSNSILAVYWSYISLLHLWSSKMKLLKSNQNNFFS